MTPTAADSGPSTPDAFAAAGIRRRVLAAWTDSPARFREDANAEEDLLLGGYRDRLLVELAQNAADAATRAGSPGRLRLHLVDGVLSAANTGSPLDEDGVSALSTLRASAKRDGTSVGRFGVGFAAVLGACDDPQVRSRNGGVKFSAERSRELVRAIPALSAELDRRTGTVPILRLPFDCTDAPPAGFDTEVRLALRPGAEPEVRRQLAEFDVDILLALTGLAEIDVDGRLLTRSGDRRAVPGRIELRDGGTTRTWAVSDAAGPLPSELLAERPVEERQRRSWQLRWAVPVDDRGRPEPLPPGQVVHAPTASDEPLSLPVRLIASYPLAPDRRHVAPGRVTDLITAAAATAYAELLAGLAGHPTVLALLPRVGLAAAALDAALCREIGSELRRTAWLPTAPGDRVTAARAAVLDPANDELVAALAEVVPGLVPSGWNARSARAALDLLGVARLSTADVVAVLSTVDRPDGWLAAGLCGTGRARAAGGSGRAGRDPGSPRGRADGVRRPRPAAGRAGATFHRPDRADRARAADRGGRSRAPAAHQARGAVGYGRGAAGRPGGPRRGRDLAGRGRSGAGRRRGALPRRRGRCGAGRAPVVGRAGPARCRRRVERRRRAGAAGLAAGPGVDRRRARRTGPGRGGSLGSGRAGGGRRTARLLGTAGRRGRGGRRPRPGRHRAVVRRGGRPDARCGHPADGRGRRRGP